MAQHGLSTAQHDNMDVSAYNRRILERLDAHRGGTIVDVFSGGGRDILSFYNTLDGEGDFIAIDAEPQRLVDMVSKNFETAREYGVGFEIVPSAEALADTLARGQIAAIQGRFPDRATGNHETKSDIDLKADFMNCSAGIMFVSPGELEDTIDEMANMLASGGELTLRFSLAREDKKDKLGESYFIHPPARVTQLLEDRGFAVTRHNDIPDPSGRPFSWIDLQAFKP